MEMNPQSTAIKLVHCSLYIWQNVEIKFVFCILFFVSSIAWINKEKRIATLSRIKTKGNKEYMNSRAKWGQTSVAKTPVYKENSPNKLTYKKDRSLSLSITYSF